METLYLVSAVLGATILLGQTVLTALGLGHHGDLGHDAGGSDGDSSGDHEAANDDSHDGAQGHSPANDAKHFIGVLSFRTVTAAVAFFGLAGMAGTTAGLGSPQPLLLALAAGAAAMYGVYYLMRGLYGLNCDGAQRIERAVGREAIVYLSIPAANCGSGKIHLVLQNRLIEVEAVTQGGPLATGSNVRVMGVLGADRVEVAAAPKGSTTESSRAAHV